MFFHIRGEALLVLRPLNSDMARKPTLSSKVPQLPSKNSKKKHRCRVSEGCNPKQTDGLVLIVILPFYPKTLLPSLTVKSHAGRTNRGPKRYQAQNLGELGCMCWSNVAGGLCWWFRTFFSRKRKNNKGAEILMKNYHHLKIVYFWELRKLVFFFRLIFWTCEFWWFLRGFFGGSKLKRWCNLDALPSQNSPSIRFMLQLCFVWFGMISWISVEWYFVGICCECRKLKSFLGVAVRIGIGICCPKHLDLLLTGRIAMSKWAIDDLFPY